MLHVCHVECCSAFGLWKSWAEGRGVWRRGMCLGMSSTDLVCSSLINGCTATVHINPCWKININIWYTVHNSPLWKITTCLFVFPQAFKAILVMYEAGSVIDNRFPARCNFVCLLHCCKYVSVCHKNRKPVLTVGFIFLPSSTRELHQPSQPSQCQNPSFAECQAAWRA